MIKSLKKGVSVLASLAMAASIAAALPITASAADKPVAEVETPPKAIDGLVYTGAIQQLFTAGTAKYEGTAVFYQVNDSAWLGINPIYRAPAGEYKVAYMAAGVNAKGGWDDSTYSRGEIGYIYVTIAQATNELTTEPVGTVLAANGEEQELIDTAAVAKFGTVQYSLSEDGEWTSDTSELVASPTETGTKTVYYKVEGNNNYTGLTGSFDVSIVSEANELTTEPEVVFTTYNGEEQSLVTTPAAAKYGTVKYQLNGGEWTTDPTTFKGTDAGNYTINYKVDGTSGYSTIKGQEIAVIQKKTAEIETAPTPIEGLVYNGELQVLFNPGTAKDGGLVFYGLAGGPYLTDQPLKRMPAGTYEIAYKPTGPTYRDSNWTHGTEGTISVTIAKATPEVTAPTAHTLGYTGEAQALVTAGSTTGGTIQYKLGEDGEYSTAIPTAADEGTYTVYYKVVGSNDYEDVAEQSVTASIVDASKPTASTTKTFTTVGTGTQADTRAAAAVSEVIIPESTSVSSITWNITDAGNTGSATATYSGTLSGGNYIFGIVIDGMETDPVVTVDFE